MPITYFDGKNMIFQGHVLEILPQIPNETVQCVVTSPPYWGLRDYRVDPIVWGGDLGCEHEWGSEKKKPIKLQAGNPEFQRNWREKATSDGATQDQFCIHCNAWLGQLGLEPSSELYVQHLTMIFHEIHRILKKDGVIWLVMGDTYASGAQRNTGRNDANRRGTWGKFEDGENIESHSGGKKLTMDCSTSSLKPKNLVGIPWRIAFALQSDGWWLRQDIIWSKPNCIPESVKDRCTRSHEYIFLLTKSQKYYYDSDAIKEPYSEFYLKDKRHKTGSTDKNVKHGYNEAMAQNPKQFHRLFTQPIGKGKNRRSVWWISVKPFKDAHFAVFPPEIPEICIKAGSREGDYVFDPFLGSGTTALKASELNRNYIGIELNPDYMPIIGKRLGIEMT